MIEQLYVHAGGRRVGVLRPDLSFAYDEDWLVSDDGYALSRSLPLREGVHTAQASAFFGNLLPEGSTRELVCQKLAISQENDFALLAALGRDCAGALVISPDPEPIDQGQPRYRKVTAEELERFDREHSYLASAWEPDVRLSLAGAQDKLPVFVGGEELYLPLAGAPSNALLKPRHRTFARLPENELFLGRLATAIGLPVARAEPWPLPGGTGLLVRRYDRREEGDRTVRLHQEDLCQALGYSRHAKYEEEGGPGFAQCYRLVRDVSMQPLEDTRALLCWLVFCAVAGNRDNHAKNLSLLRQEGWRLAPFYDLVCTRVYPRLSPRLAMGIGEQHDVGALSRAAWTAEAARLEIGAKYLLGLVEDVVERIEQALPQVRHEVDAIVEPASITAVCREIGKGLRAVRRSL